MNKSKSINPLVKRIVHWFAETLLACFLEIMLEAFVHSWNRCTEVFNLNLRQFEVEYLFEVSNALDATTIYDVKDFTDELLTDTQEATCQRNNNAQVIPQELSASEEEFKECQDFVCPIAIIENEKSIDYTKSKFSTSEDEFK